MKRLLVIFGLLLGAALLFVGSFVAVVRNRGGLGSAHSRLAELPVVGRLLPVKKPGDGDPEQGKGPLRDEAPSGGEMPFLRFGPRSRLSKLAEELEHKQLDYDDKLHALERRSDELEVWEQQLKKERDAVRQRLNAERRELVQLKEALAQREAELNKRQLLIRASQEDNLKKTAEIYGKMDPESAARVLTEMYASDQQDTVVELIYLMKDRSAAKTLAAMADPKVCAQITASLKKIGREEDLQEQEG